MKYLTTKDLSKLFYRAPETIRYWIRSCHLAHYGQRFGREWLFTPEAIVAFIEEEMSSWYAEKQWQQAHHALDQIKKNILSQNGRKGRKTEASFKSYKMGKIQGQLSRRELYSGR